MFGNERNMNDLMFSKSYFTRDSDFVFPFGILEDHGDLVELSFRDKGVIVQGQ